MLLVILFCAMSLTAVADEEAKKVNVEDTFKINSDAKHFKKPKSKIPPKTELCTLTHKKHADLTKSCKICHHELASDDKSEWSKAKKCSSEGCHSANPHGEGKKCLSLKSAMHNNCYKDCHKKDEAAIKAKAPTKCGQCHIKIKK